MKKLSMFQVILMIVFGAFTIAGILVFAFAIGGGAANTIGPIKIWGTLDQAAFSAVLRQASESNAQLSQVSYEQKDPTTYEQDLTNALAAGQGPDLFLLTQEYAIKNAPKVAGVPSSALSQSQFSNTFVDAASPLSAENGSLAVPFVADPLILYWNKDMLATGGFAQPPRYWDEIFEMAKRITKRDDAGVIQKSAVAFGEYRNVDHAKDIVATLIMQAGGTITARDQGGRLVPALTPRTGEASQASVSALRFYTEFANPSKDDYTWNRSLRTARDAFAAGDLALYVGYASEYAGLARQNPNLNFSVAALPQIRTNATSLNTARVYGFAASRAGRNPTAAITVAFLLASNENARALSVALGIPPARRDLLSLPAQGENDLFNKQAILSQAWLDPDPEKTAEVFRGMIENTTSGSLLVAEAIGRADQEMARILGI